MLYKRPGSKNFIFGYQAAEYIKLLKAQVDFHKIC